MLTSKIKPTNGPKRKLLQKPCMIQDEDGVYLTLNEDIDGNCLEGIIVIHQKTNHVKVGNYIGDFNVEEMELFEGTVTLQGKVE